jgi:hypothetical protein
MSQLKDNQAETTNSPFTLSFCLFCSWKDGWGPTTVESTVCFTQPLVQMPISSRNILTDTPRIMFSQTPGHLVAQSHWHIKLTITIHLLSIWHSYTGDPWHLWVCGSKETTLEEKLGMLRKCSVQYFTGNAWFIFPIMPTTQLLLKTCCLSTNLKISLYHLNWAHWLLPCFLVMIWFLEDIVSQN